MSADRSLSAPSKWKKGKEKRQSGCLTQIVLHLETSRKIPFVFSVALFYIHFQTECYLVCCCHGCHMFTVLKMYVQVRAQGQ